MVADLLSTIMDHFVIASISLVVGLALIYASFYIASYAWSLGTLNSSSKWLSENYPSKQTKGK